MGGLARIEAPDATTTSAGTIVNRRARITIKDVAHAAGVSTQTVSRVLNDHPDVAPATGERVQRVIAEMGYQPNLLARGLSRGQTHSLGVVAYGLDYFGPSRILTGIEQQAASLGYSMSLTLIHRPETHDVDDLLSELAGRQVDGIIWAIPEVADNRSWLRPGARHLPLPLPLTVVGGTTVRIVPPAIGIDNRAIGRIATGHILAGGAERVAVITGPLDWWEARERMVGAREALRAVDRRLPQALVFEGDWTASSGDEGLRCLLEADPTIDAVFASNDQMALGAMHAAHGLGLRIPERLSVVGVDDTAEGSHYWPPLTTVHQPLVDAGVLAVETIVRAIADARAGRLADDAGPAQVTLLEPELIVRESSRKPTAG
jgi:LacI family transcriptional regulator